MIVLGLVLFLIGWFAHIQLLYIVGAILVVIGLVLLIVGTAGPVSGRWY